MGRLVAVNEKGLRLGEDHQRAKLTNHEVECIRRLHSDGMDYLTIAQKFDVSKSVIARICRFEIRATAAIRWKTVA
jgi:DNA invertase Pin-like site-specific DNA recombinase